MKTVIALLIFSIPALAQIGAIREETKTTNPDGSVTFTRKFDPPAQQAPVVEYRAPVATAPTVRYMVVQPEVRFVEAPAVMYAFPVAAKTPVAQYRTGLFGLRKNVVHADGTTTQYGLFGRRR